VLYVLVVLAHDRRRVVHFNVTAHPTAAWTAQQIIEAFPEDTAPRFLLRDRDQIYGEEFRRRVAGMRIEEVMTAPHSPWQSPYVERLIGSIRRECLDHVIVLGENHLRRTASLATRHPRWFIIVGRCLLAISFAGSDESIFSPVTERQVQRACATTVSEPNEIHCARTDATASWVALEQTPTRLLMSP
jgi:transposase InsO family protein